MDEYKYCVVKMQLPNKNDGDFVCISSCWIVPRRKKDQTIIVNYPMDENVKTRKRLKKKIGDPGEWRSLKAVVQYATDFYTMAKTFINSRKNCDINGKTLREENCAGLNDGINSSSKNNNQEILNNQHSKEKNRDVIPSTVSEEQLRIVNHIAESNPEVQTLTEKFNTTEKSVKEKASKRTLNSEQKHNIKRSKITTQTTSSNIALKQSSKQTKGEQLSHNHEVESVNLEYTQPISVENSNEQNTKIIESSSQDNVPKASTSKDLDTPLDNIPGSNNLEEDSKQNHDHKQNNNIEPTLISKSTPQNFKNENEVKNIQEIQNAGSHPTYKIEGNNQTHNATSSNRTTFTDTEDKKTIEKRMNYNFGGMIHHLINIPEHKQIILKYRDIMEAVLMRYTDSTI